MRFNRFVFSILILTAAVLLAANGSLPPAPASPQTQAELSAALTERLSNRSTLQSITLDLFIPELDTAFVSPDGQSAVLWLALRDDSKRLLATEPGLALARRIEPGWQALLPGDPGWDETLAALPAGMLPAEHSPVPPDAVIASSLTTQALTGYYLPYAAGTSRWLEGSISHFQSIPELGYPSCSIEYCHYAYDFTDTWHFPLLASRAGTVFASRDSCSDGNPSCTNYIVLRDTSGETYQIYLHLAHATIPDQLTEGTAVLRGQYLGDSDDTGYSTSQHVHFMVTNSIWVGGDGYYWGNSVDIRFADVGINGGIPRTCYEVTNFAIYDGATECLGNRADPRNPANDWFVSGNVGAYPPEGALTRPAAGAVVAAGDNPLMDVTAQVSDDVGVAAVSLVAKAGGQWVEIGPKVTQAAAPGLFDWDVNLCAAGPFNGPLEVALRAWDHEGNLAPALGARTIQVDHACPPPASQMQPAETFDSTAVRLRWDAASAGAGLDSFELQWRSDPGLWEAANTLTISGEQRETWFAGQAGGAYAFRLRALDVNSQPEAWPAGDAAETSAVLPSVCTPDTFEPDDDLAHAGALTPGEWAERNLCGPGNADWFQVDLTQPGAYYFRALSQSGGAAVKMSVYDAGGATLLAQAAAPGVGQAVVLPFHPATAGVYTLVIEPLTDGLMGTEAVYRVEIAPARRTFLPLVAR